MRPLIIVANWKMHGSFSRNQTWMQDVCHSMAQGMPSGRRYAVCAPFPYLAQCAELLRVGGVAALSLGAQEVSAHLDGPYTGEVSAPMLAELSCSYVIVGHSERRDLHQETDEQIAEKALLALDHGLTPIICVGETADQRNSGRAEEVVRSQIARQVTVLQDRLVDSLIAYEPVWAIGTGKVATAQVAQDMHRAIRHQLAEFNDDVASHIGILYGGSVKPENAAELFVMPDIDGALVGGASLIAEDFLAICRA